MILKFARFSSVLKKTLRPLASECFEYGADKVYLIDRSAAEELHNRRLHKGYDRCYR